MSDKVKYKNIESLNLVNNIINEAAKEVNEPKKEIQEEEVKEIVGLTAGAGVGTATSVGLLALLGTNGFSAAGITSALTSAGTLVGGGMAAGLGLIATPIALLGAAGYVALSKKKKKKLVKVKKELLEDAICKQNLIKKELNNKTQLKQEKLDCLNAANISLKILIKDLKDDLGRS